MGRAKGLTNQASSASRTVKSSSPSAAFQRVFGDNKTEGTRRIAIAEQAAVDANNKANKARQETMKEQRLRKEAEARSERADKSATKALESARNSEKHATEENYEKRLILDALRDRESRLEQYEPSKPPEPIAGQVSFLSFEGAICLNGILEVRYKTKNNNYQTMTITSELYHLLTAIETAATQNRNSESEELSNQFMKLAAKQSISKTRCGRLLSEARSDKYQAFPPLNDWPSTEDIYSDSKVSSSPPSKVA
jgi:hypothetical protein